MRLLGWVHKLLDNRRKKRKVFPMGREIKLDGGEISVLKKIGLSGTPVYGKMLLDRVEGMESAEFLETLKGLIDQGYVLSNKVNLHSLEDTETAFFRVNATYASDLRDAVNPGRRRERERNERRPRRR